MNDEVAWFLLALVCSALGLSSIAGLVVILISDTKKATARRRRESMTRRSASLPPDELISPKGKTNLGARKTQHILERNKALTTRTPRQGQKASERKRR